MECVFVSSSACFTRRPEFEGKLKITSTFRTKTINECPLKNTNDSYKVGPATRRKLGRFGSVSNNQS
jgi:hypothetical protein